MNKAPLQVIKNQIRKKVKEELKILNQDICLCLQKSFLATKNVLNSKEYKEAELVFLFLSCGTEIKTNYFVDAVFKSEKDLYLPRTENDKMFFYKINKEFPLNLQLEKGEFGIYVPTQNSNAFNLRASLLDSGVDSLKNVLETKKILVIAPGLAFNQQGHRLGKGKGFYDKLLSELLKNAKNVKIIGFCYDIQVKTTIPTCKTDIKMNYIATEKAFFHV